MAARLFCRQRSGGATRERGGSRPHTFGWCWDGIACKAVSPLADPAKTPWFKIALAVYPGVMCENLRRASAATRGRLRRRRSQEPQPRPR